LFWRAVPHEDITENEVGPKNAREAHPASRQFFEDDGKCGVVDFVAAVLIGSIQAEETEFLHRLNECIGVLIAMFHFRCNRNNLTVDELADRLRNELLVLIKVNHGVSYRQLPAFRS
jgi:hypothetical protein